jgi:hypothetical protein
VCNAPRRRPLWHLDRIGSDREEEMLVRLRRPCSVERFHCAISSRVWRSHLSHSLITSPRLDLGFLVRIRRKFLIYYTAKPFSGIRARSMHRCASRVERNMLVVDVDIFCCKPLCYVFLMARHSEIEVVQANFTWPYSWDRLCTWRVACSTYAAGECQFLSL